MTLLVPRGSGEGFALVEGVGLVGKKDLPSLKSAGNLSHAMAKTHQKPFKHHQTPVVSSHDARPTPHLLNHLVVPTPHTSPNGMSSLSFCVCAQVAATL